MPKSADGPPLSSAVQRWADAAMYRAEPVDAASGPKVYLLAATADPLGAIAASAAIYEGRVVRDLSEVTRADRERYLREMQKTKLKAPLEFVQFHFLLEGVTRGFTHQLVRQRTATYCQESTRFAVKEDVPVGLPPSLVGTEPLDGNTFGDNLSSEEFNEQYDRLSQPQKWRSRWDTALQSAEAAYSDLVASGMPAEDARGLLPTNLLTRVHYRTDLRALLDHAGNRLCTQAQFEWRLVFAKIAEALRSYAGEPATGLYYNCPETSPSGGTYRAARHAGWQFEAIADLLRPVCYQVGKCVFEAEFDRKCSIRGRVQANAAIGRPSSKWQQEHDEVEGNPVVSGVGPHSVVRDERGTPVFIGAIQSAEWLLDPGAAR